MSTLLANFDLSHTDLELGLIKLQLPQFNTLKLHRRSSSSFKHLGPSEHNLRIVDAGVLRRSSAAHSSDKRARRSAKFLLSEPDALRSYNILVENPTMKTRRKCYSGTADSCSQNFSCLSVDLLHSILERLPPADLLQAALVCKSWAKLCEKIFKDECDVKRWYLPRIPWGVTHPYLWRSLYYRHKMCRACGKVGHAGKKLGRGKPGEFFMRASVNGKFQFILCCDCIKLPEVRNRLLLSAMDRFIVTRKRLLPKFHFSDS